MGKYRDDPNALAARVRDDEVHRDVYIDPEVFELEMERLWSRTWVYVGHESQVPAPGDYFTTDVATQPVIMVRHADRSVRVLMNRCAHKGSKLVGRPTATPGAPSGARTTPGRSAPTARCSARRCARATRARACTRPRRAAAWCRSPPSCIAASCSRIEADGPTVREYFVESLSSIDFLADRSPEGGLEIAGGVLRYMHNCNWKFYVENLNDAMHPMVAHESSAGTARKLWEGKPADMPNPMAVEQFVPFVNDYKFFDDMGERVFDNGHSYSGVNFSIHSKYTAMPGYEEKMIAACGEERAKTILGTKRHNTVYYPNLTIKGEIQSIRVARPIAADRTLIESWTFRLKGAPPEMLRRTIMCTRLINSPMSVVGHDDLHAYRGMQEGLRCAGNEWVSLHRDFKPEELAGGDRTVNGLSEISMRSQFRAWKRFMSGDPPAVARAVPRAA